MTTYGSETPGPQSLSLRPRAPRPRPTFALLIIYSEISSVGSAKNNATLYCQVTMIVMFWGSQFHNFSRIAIWGCSLHVFKIPKNTSLELFSKWICRHHCLCVCLSCCLFVGHVMSSHYTEQKSQRSLFEGVLWMYLYTLIKCLKGHKLIPSKSRGHFLSEWVSITYWVFLRLCQFTHYLPGWNNHEPIKWILVELTWSSIWDLFEPSLVHLFSIFYLSLPST